jgi:hypothetical protein
MDKDKGFLLFIDHDRYTWDQDTITGAQLRVLGAIPDGVEIFLQVPGKPDDQIFDNSVVNLKEHHGPAKFSTQSRGSQAG